MALIISSIKYVPKQEQCVHHIIDNLYLGTEDSRRYLQELNIEKVVEVGEESELSSYMLIEAEKLSIEIADIRQADISKHFQEVCDFIEKDSKNTLVHCKMGVSRSVSLVVAYLILKKKYTYDQAIKHIEEKRNSAIYTHPNTGFMKVLRKL